MFFITTQEILCGRRITLGLRRNYSGNKNVHRKASGYWNNKENVQEFLQKLQTELKLNTINDWNSITQKQIIQNGGSRLLGKYSIYDIKCMGNPEGKSIYKQSHEYKLYNFWQNQENLSNFLNLLKEKLNLKTFDDWNSLTTKQILNYGGNGLLKLYSLNEIKQLGFPEGKDYFPKSIEKKPSKYWDNRENIEKFLKEIQIKLNLKTAEDWNLLTQKQIKQFGGASLLNLFSMYELKCIGFPDGENFFTKANSYKAKGYWEKKENVLNFLEDLKVKLNLQTINDWNLISSKDIIKYGGSSLLNLHSMFDLKCMICPDGKFLFSKSICKKSHGFWDKNENIHEFVDKFKQKYNLRTPEDWNRISKAQMIQNGGGGLSKYSFDEIINYVPELKDQNIKKNVRSSQRWLFLQIQNLFPQEEIVEDYFHSDLSRESGFSIQFDIFLVNRNIAIEYHGKQHYEDIPAAFSPLELYQQRDNEKQNLCKKYGINLIIIPYWWNNKLNSLKNTIENKIKN